MLSNGGEGSDDFCRGKVRNAGALDQQGFAVVNEVTLVLANGLVPGEGGRILSGAI